jgi:hypothetical protein
VVVLLARSFFFYGRRKEVGDGRCSRDVRPKAARTDDEMLLNKIVTLGPSTFDVMMAFLIDIIAASLNPTSFDRSLFDAERWALGSIRWFTGEIKIVAIFKKI